MATKFRKKAVEIEALKFEGGHVSMLECAEFIGEAAVTAMQTASLAINTLEGLMKVSPGDYVIRGVKGEFYPCKPDIFAATYEPVVEVSAPPTRTEEPTEAELRRDIQSLQELQRPTQPQGHVEERARRITTLSLALEALRLREQIETMRQMVLSGSVPPTIATDEEFRSVYSQGYRHALLDFAKLLPPERP